VFVFSFYECSIKTNTSAYKHQRNIFGIVYIYISSLKNSSFLSSSSQRLYGVSRDRLTHSWKQRTVRVICLGDVREGQVVDLHYLCSLVHRVLLWVLFPSQQPQGLWVKGVR